MINEIVFFGIPCVGECRINTNKGYTSYPVEFTIIQRCTDDKNNNTYRIRLNNGVECAAYWDTEKCVFYYLYSEV